MQRDHLALRGATLLVVCTMVLVLNAKAGLALLVGGWIGLELEIAFDKGPR